MSTVGYVMICDVEVGGFGIVVYRAFGSTMLCEAHNIKETVFDRLLIIYEDYFQFA